MAHRENTKYPNSIFLFAHYISTMTHSLSTHTSYHFVVVLLAEMIPSFITPIMSDHHTQWHPVGTWRSSSIIRWRRRMAQKDKAPIRSSSATAKVINKVLLCWKFSCCTPRRINYFSVLKNFLSLLVSRRVAWFGSTELQCMRNSSDENFEPTPQDAWRTEVEAISTVLGLAGNLKWLVFLLDDFVSSKTRKTQKQVCND